MKILFVLENGGVEAVFKNLAEGLAKQGHTVAVVTHQLKGTKKFEIVKNVRIYRVSCLGSRYLFSILAVPIATRLAKKADIIHTTTFNGAPPAWIASRLARKKVVVTVHEVWIGLWKQLADMGSLGKILHEVGERIMYTFPYDHYVAVSDSTKKQLLSIGINPRKISRVYNAVNYEQFNPKKYSRETIRRKYKLGKQFVYLTYGRPGVSKGIEYVVRAVKQIKAKIPHSKLILILSKDPAYGKYYDRIMRGIANLGIRNDILLLPPVSWHEVPNYIKAADCVVVPSLSEGFGYTVAEAVAMDVPVVATNTTSLPEVVSGKHLLVKPKSSEEIAAAVEKVYKHKYKITKKKMFSLRENRDGYIEVYKKVLQETESGTRAS